MQKVYHLKGEPPLSNPKTYSYSHTSSILSLELSSNFGSTLLKLTFKISKQVIEGKNQMRKFYNEKVNTP